MYAFSGFCPCCENGVTFSTTETWFRDNLLCPICNSVVRERALALVLNQLVPDWRKKRIHESSPADRGISLKLRLEAPRYLATHFFVDQKKGDFIGEFRNENLEQQTFYNETFDIVISLDVMEHVFNPDLVYKEIYRTLCPGGIYIHTFPIKKSQIEAAIPRARLNRDGTISHLVKVPEYHGNPIDSCGSLVTFDYGYDISKKIPEWAPFDVCISRYWDQRYGIIGEYTEVIICHKR